MLALYSLVTLLLTIAATPLLTRLMGRNAGWVIALIDLILACLYAPHGSSLLNGETLTADIPWISYWDIHIRLRLDALSWFFAMLALVIGAIVMAYSTRYFHSHDHAGKPLHHTSFFLLMVIFTFSMILLVTADDLILLFIGWELTSLMSFMLIGRSGHAGEAGSLRTLFLTFTGGVFFLIATVVTISLTGTTNLTQALASDAWITRPGMTTTVAVFVAIGAFTKSAQFPFHLWLPEAMAAESPVSAYLHAAAVVKAGIYVLLRFSAVFRLNLTWQILLVVIGMFTAVMGALFALQKTDLKKLLAYSTVSQLGWIVTTIGIGTHAALTAALLHTLAHALFKSGLFMSIGALQHATGTRDIRRLPPMWKHTPVLMVVTVIGAIGMAGIPPTLGFVSKESMLSAFLNGWGGNAGAIVLTIVGVLGAALTVAYSFRIILGGFFDGDRAVAHDTAAGTTASAAADHSTAAHTDHDGYELVLHKIPWVLTFFAALPAIAGLPLYFVVPKLGNPFSRIAECAINTHTASYRDALLHHGAQIHPTQLHLLTANWVLLLSVIAIVIGVLLVWQRKRVDALLRRELLPHTGAENLATIWKGMHWAGSMAGAPTRSDSPTRHVGAFVTVLALLAATVTVSRYTGHIHFPERLPGVNRPIDLVVLIIVLAGSAAAIVTRSRLAAVVLLGVVGVGITLQIFALGAPDVGLTQLLVEIISTVMYMLVLRRLPRTFQKASRRRKISAGIIAVLSGLGAFGAVMVFTARRDRSSLSQYFLDHGPDLTTGKNVTNTIINEFRGFDTFGEMAVLGVTGLAIAAVLLSVHPEYRRTGSASFHLIRKELRERVECNGRVVLPTSYSYRDGITDSYPLRIFTAILSPVLVVTAIVVFLRGHQEPGGGFIAGLILATLLVLVWLSTPVDRPLTRRRTPPILVATGISIATITGLIGFFTTETHTVNDSVSSHSFLSPQHWNIPVLGSVPSATFFDFGITLCVLGMVLTALNLLGSGQSPYGAPSVEVWPPYDPLRIDPLKERPLTLAASRAAAASTAPPDTDDTTTAPQTTQPQTTEQTGGEEQ